MNVKVGVLGATGNVGQRFVQLLENHPWFEVEALTASKSSVGKPYSEAANWYLGSPMPDDVRDITVSETSTRSVSGDVELVFSALPSSVAKNVEPEFAQEGYVVASNAGWARMDEDVPLLIPEVNPEHLGLLEIQRDERGWDGALIKNPNCSAITLTPTLAALHDFGLSKATVATLQAVSGAGYSGVKSMQILDNVLPYIGGEEGKVETEPLKILGTFDGAEIQHAGIDISATCNRVATIDGHLENVWAEFDEKPSLEDVKESMSSFNTLDLPSAPENTIFVHEQPDRPQPRLDRDIGDGMTVSVGRIREDSRGVKYTCLAHNTIRGAAGASLLNGELIARELL
ncbi:MAG: aspartate-semialdehyde dehydrogenase [Halobacteria archaeon]|nr:aspartate-semialdehyde dehydrogenase [Halobacteria archaeon]